MPKDDLTEFINKNQSLITAVALFSALSGFFIQINSQTKGFSFEFLPLIASLIAVFVLFHVYVKLDKKQNKDWWLSSFKILLLCFLFFMCVFILEYWHEGPKIFWKLVLLVIMLLFLSWFIKLNLRKKWFHGTTLGIQNMILYVITYLCLTLSVILLLTKENCVTNEYVEFGLYAFSFSILIFMIIITTDSYNDLFRDVSSNKEKIISKISGKTSIILFFLIAVSIIVAFLIIKYGPIQLLVEWFLKLIFLPRNVFCP